MIVGFNSGLFSIGLGLFLGPFYWGFVARVSRGRTIREFVVGVLIIPPLISFTWIAGFGGTAIKLALNHNDKLVHIVDKDYTVALFELLSHFPLSEVTSSLAIVLIFIFIVTSADSTTHIVAGMATGGSINPTLKHKVLWGLLIGAISVAMTIAGGLKVYKLHQLLQVYHSLSFYY